MDERVDAVREELEARKLRADQGEGVALWSVPRNEGQWLSLLVHATGARSILEVGASAGYSGLWLAEAARDTGGKVVTLERDPVKVDMARDSYRRAGLEPWITLLPGDARMTLASLEGPWDLVFLDAWKDDYILYLAEVWPKLRPGGLLLADNAQSHAADLAEYLQAVRTRPDGESLLLPVGNGLEITFKRAGA